MGNVEGVVIVVLMVLVFLGPSVLLAYFGWRSVRDIGNEYQRIAIRSAILSIAFAPTVYGHAGPMFASWAIFLVPGPDKFAYGLMPIIVVWVIGGGIATAARWFKNKRRLNENAT
jgi:hypothetical protein